MISGPWRRNRSRIIVSSLGAIARLSHRLALRMMEECEIVGLCRSRDAPRHVHRALTSTAHRAKHMVPGPRVEEDSEGLHHRAEDRGHDRDYRLRRRISRALIVGHRPVESARRPPSLKCAPHRLRHIESALLGPIKVKDGSTTIRHTARLRPIGGGDKMEILYPPLWKQHGAPVGRARRVVLPLDKAPRITASEPVWAGFQCRGAKMREALLRSAAIWTQNLAIAIAGVSGVAPGHQRMHRSREAALTSSWGT